jgi:RecB family exonuclease
MPGVLVTGRWHPELEGAFLESVRELRGKDPLSPLVIAVGSLTLSRHLRHAIAREIGSTAGINIVLLFDLAQKLAAGDVAACSLRPFPPLATVPLVRDVCSSHASLSYFSGMRGKRGFSRALSSTFEDLRESGIQAESLRRASKSPKTGESSALYARYLEKKRGYYDPHDVFEEAAARAPLFEARFGSRHFLLYGFYDLTELQRKLIEALISSTDPVIFFPHEESREYEYTERALGWFRSLDLPEKRLPALEKRFVPKRAPATVGERSQGQAERPKGSGQDVALRVMSAPGRWREVREITRSLIAHATEGIPFHRMMVLFRDPGSYLDLLLESFEEAGIPYDLHIGRPLAKTRTGKSLLLLFELLRSDLPRPLVSSFLSLAPIDYDARFGISLESPMVMDIVSRQAGIVKGEGEWREKLAIHVKKTAAVPLEERDLGEEGAGGSGDNRTHDACRLLLGLVERFGEMKKSLEGIESWEGLAEFCDGLMTDFFAVTDETERMRNALRRLSGLDGIVPPPTLPSSVEVISELLDASTSRGGSQPGRGVMVTDLMGARGVSADVVAIPGLIEGGFPAKVRQDPIILDRERDTIRESLGAGPFALPPKWTRIREEKLLFRLAANSARTHLILSYPRIDPQTAKPHLPSYLLLHFIEELVGRNITFENLDGLECVERILVSSLVPRAGEVLLSTVEYDLSEVRGATDRKKTESIRYLVELSPYFGRSLVRHRARRLRGVFTPYDGALRSGALSPPAREKLELSGRTVAPRRLETYAACPFAYFVKHVLGLTPLEEPEEEMALSSMKKGSLYHMVLEKIVPKFAELNESGLASEKSLRAAMNLLDDCYRIFAQEEATGVPMIWEIEKETVGEDVARYLRELATELSDWEPRFVEKSFGREGGGCLEYTTAGGEKLLLRGKIDRVDVSRSGEGYRIVDYKTGNPSTKRENDFKGGESLQLAFYLLAGALVLALGDVKEGVAWYHHVTRKGDYARVPMRGSDWNDLRPEFDSILETITTGIRAGIFPSFPQGENGRCSYCDARAMCPGDAAWIFERKMSDERLKGFLAMKERKEKK